LTLVHKAETCLFWSVEFRKKTLTQAQLEGEQQVMEVKGEGKITGWLLPKSQATDAKSPVGSRPWPGEVGEIHRTGRSIVGKRKEDKRHKSNIFKKEQCRVKSFGLTDLALQYQSFCQHWEILHLKLMLSGKNKNGKKILKKNLHFFSLCKEKKPPQQKDYFDQKAV